jgi:hypothetical protein
VSETGHEEEDNGEFDLVYNGDGSDDSYIPMLMVKIAVRWCRESEYPEADIDTQHFVGVLDQLMDGESSIVWLERNQARFRGNINHIPRRQAKSIDSIGAKNAAYPRSLCPQTEISVADEMELEWWGVGMG